MEQYLEGVDVVDDASKIKMATRYLKDTASLCEEFRLRKLKHPDYKRDRWAKTELERREVQDLATLMLHRKPRPWIETLHRRTVQCRNDQKGKGTNIREAQPSTVVKVYALRVIPMRLITLCRLMKPSAGKSTLQRDVERLRRSIERTTCDSVSVPAYSLDFKVVSWVGIFSIRVRLIPMSVLLHFLLCILVVGKTFLGKHEAGMLRNGANTPFRPCNSRNGFKPEQAFSICGNKAIETDEGSSKVGVRITRR
ncbi:hypothetical protein Tco_1093452 [Tanacetum coccineum]|uniref:Uncharacterized protein n=1 Tax=Tanacetum coccineum TaxID=301880 RepID=A0ABQ5IE37_9ASTR